MKATFAIALFEMADFEIKSMHEIPNGYWPHAYIEMREKNPWWLFETEFGIIKIGWRKRVISIDWESTKIKIPDLTEDDVTKNDYLVHAWSYSKALEYLTNLNQAMQKIVRESKSGG